MNIIQDHMSKIIDWVRSNILNENTQKLAESSFEEIKVSEIENEDTSTAWQTMNKDVSLALAKMNNEIELWYIKRAKHSSDVDIMDQR